MTLQITVASCGYKTWLRSFRRFGPIHTSTLFTLLDSPCKSSFILILLLFLRFYHNITKPIQELVDLRDGDATVTLLKTWAKKLGWRPVDLANVVQSPRKVAKLEETISKIEQVKNGSIQMKCRFMEFPSFD